MNASLLSPARITARAFSQSPFVAGLLAIVAATTTVSAQPRYLVTDLGVLPGATDSVGLALNDRGDVVGHCAPGANGLSQEAFLWHNGVMTSLGQLDKSTYTSATAINDSGLVAGEGDYNFRPQGWVATAKGPFNFFPNNGGNTRVVAVTDAGAIGGYYTKSLSGNTASWRGAIWTVDPKDSRKWRLNELPILPGIDPTKASSVPWAFNRSGQAAGYAVNDVIGQHACFWNNDAAHTIIDLGGLPGSWSSLAYGINDLGQVVGTSHPPAQSLPTVWNNDAAHTPYPLAVLPGDNNGTASAINRLGHVLGTSYYSIPGTWTSTPARLVLWRDGSIFELSSVLDPTTAAGWTLTAAFGLNNAGQIVGLGVHFGKNRAFLLTPL